MSNYSDKLTDLVKEVTKLSETDLTEYSLPEDPRYSQGGYIKRSEYRQWFSGGMKGGKTEVRSFPNLLGAFTVLCIM